MNPALISGSLSVNEVSVTPSSARFRREAATIRAPNISGEVEDVLSFYSTWSSFPSSKDASAQSQIMNSQCTFLVTNTVQFREIRFKLVLTQTLSNLELTNVKNSLFLFFFFFKHQYQERKCRKSIFYPCYSLSYCTVLGMVHIEL